MSGVSATVLIYRFSKLEVTTETVQVRPPAFPAHTRLGTGLGGVFGFV
jgi:hypothetical protein